MGEYIFTWRIKNYSHCFHSKGDRIKSPLLTAENLYKSEWYLWIFPKGHSSLKDKQEDFVSIGLRLKSFKGIERSDTLNFIIDILDPIDNVFKFDKFEERVFDEENNCWGKTEFVAADELAKEMDGWKEDILTIRCRMKSDRLKTICAAEANTTMNIDRGSAEWDVKIPALLKFTESIFFSISDLYIFEITLTSALEGLEVSINLKEHKPELVYPMKFKLSFYDDKENEIMSKRDEHLFKKAKMWRFPDVLTRDQLDVYIVNSNHFEFKLKCEVSVTKGTVSSDGVRDFKFKSPPTSLDILPNNASVTALQNNFRSLFINQKYSDITIRTKDEEFLAHKLVLRVQSPVFSVMFDQNMLENETGIINVTDVEGEIMKTFLEFLYTEIVDKIDYESAMKLMLVADKYQVQSLVDKCSYFLKTILSLENVCDIIVLADSVNCECLKSKATAFIKNNASKLLVSHNWVQFIGENIELATDVLSKLSVDLSSKFK